MLLTKLKTYSMTMDLSMPKKQLPEVCPVKAEAIDRLLLSLEAELARFSNSGLMLDWLLSLDGTQLKLRDYLPKPEVLASALGMTKSEVLAKSELLKSQSVAFSKFKLYLLAKVRLAQKQELRQLQVAYVPAACYKASKMPKPRHYAPTYT